MANRTRVNCATCKSFLHRRHPKSKALEGALFGLGLIGALCLFYGWFWVVITWLVPNSCQGFGIYSGSCLYNDFLRLLLSLGPFIMFAAHELNHSDD